MSVPQRVGSAVLVLVFALAPSWGSAQPAVSPEGVRELYAAAAYEDALALIGRLDGERSLGATARRDLEATRALCHLALGRQAEAEASMQKIVALDPAFEFADAAPSVRAAYQRVRQGHLRAEVRRQFTLGREAYTAGNREEAAARFRLVQQLTTDPVLTAVDDAAILADMRLLAETFLVLVTGPPPGPAAGGQRPTPSGAAAVAQRPLPQSDSEVRIVTGDEPGVVAPQVVEEHVPPWLPGHVRPAPAYEARVEVVIDQNGEVRAVRILESSDRKFDVHLLNAARNWRYRPARQHGTPVSFRKILAVSIAPQG